LVDPIFYEANESSSACRTRNELRVETSTPPVEIQSRAVPLISQGLLLGRELLAIAKLMASAGKNTP